MSLSLRPAPIAAFELTLRGFAGFAIDHDRRLRRLRQVRRQHVEAYKAWLSARPVAPGRATSARAVRHRLGILRVFFERVIEWGWADAPRSCPIFEADPPKVDDPLPRFLDDASAAALMRAAANAAPLDRLVVEVLARTGLRVGEPCALEANPVVRTGATHWLKVPIGKLHNDRYLPLHPVVAELLEAWRSEEANQDKDLLVTDHGRPLQRHFVARVVRRVGNAAGVGHVHTG
jgi:integrase